MGVGSLTQVLPAISQHQFIFAFALAALANDYVLEAASKAQDGLAFVTTLMEEGSLCSISGKPDQDNLELLTLLPPPPWCSNCRFTIPRPVL